MVDLAHSNGRLHALSKLRLKALPPLKSAASALAQLEPRLSLPCRGLVRPRPTGLARLAMTTPSAAF